MTTVEGPALAEFSGIGALTLGAFLEEVALRFAPHEALVFDDPMRNGATVRWTYAELGHQARGVASGLRAAGVTPGDAVGILMGNRPEAVAGIFGAALVGAIAVPLSTFAPRGELALMLQRAEVKVVLTQDRLLQRRFGADLDALRPQLPHLVTVAVVGTPSWDDFLAAPPDPAAAAPATVTPDDPAVVIFSSGTTSVPKGMLHAHRAATLQFWVQAQIFGRHPATRMWTALPLFWTAGFNTAMGSTLAAGGCWVMQETFEPGAALALMARERVTEPYSLPHQTAALAEHPAWAGTDLSSLTCVFGKGAFARHPRVTGDPTWMMPVGYGLSETCALFVSHWCTTPRPLTKQSMGRLLPGNRLRIVDPDSGRVLGVDEEGELALAGPTLMLRYLGEGEGDSLDADGFFHTGDAGHVDAQGYVHFSGRRTEMIKTGGANVSPAEIEVQLRAMPAVKLSRIVGIPDPRLDQVVVACITLKDGAEASGEEIRAFLKDRVAAYKLPRHVLFFADGEIPMTTSATKVRDDALLVLVHQRLLVDPVPTTPGAP